MWVAITYSAIAPLVLGWACLGMTLFYFAYRYNVLFVSDTQIDTRGLIYPRALKQLMTGVYLSEVCMIGLFGASVAPIQLALQVVFLVFTVLFHISMVSALDPLLYKMPQSLLAEEEARRIGDLEAPAPAAAGSAVISGAAGPASAAAVAAPNAAANHDVAYNEKSGTAAGAAASGSNDGLIGGDAAHADNVHFGHTGTTAPIPVKGNILLRFLKPWIYANYESMRALVPQHSNEVDFKRMYTGEVEKEAYLPPSASSKAPLLWIPEDPAGISKQEIAHTEPIIPITDTGCILNDKGKLEWDREATRPPIWTEKILY